MEKLNVTYFVKDAREKLEGKDSRRAATIHTGVIVAAGLVLTIVQMLLARGMGNATGLSGLGTVSMLQTAQTVLQYANTILAPFWNLGFLYVAMLWARNRASADRDLLTGFRRVGPCIGLVLERFLVAVLVVLASALICSYIFVKTPAGQQLEAQMIAIGAVDYYSFLENVPQQEMDAMMKSMQPVLILCGVSSVAVLVPILYRMRLAEYVVLDHKEVRALPAILISASLMRRRCWQFFKLDLQFWWYYGLKMLILAVCYADSLLSFAGVTLPISEDAAFLLSYAIYLVLLLGLEVCFRPRVETAYACAYDALREMGPVPKKNQPAIPQEMPKDAQ